MSSKITEQQRINDLIFYERDTGSGFLSIYDLNEEELKNFKNDNRYFLTSLNKSEFTRDYTKFDDSCFAPNPNPSDSISPNYVAKEDIKISFFDKVKLFMGADEQEVYYSYGYIKDAHGYYFVGNHNDSCMKESFKSYSVYEDDNDYNNFYDSEPYAKAELPEFDPVITSHYDGFGNTVWTDGFIESSNPYDDNFK